MSSDLKWGLSSCSCSPKQYSARADTQKSMLCNLNGLEVCQSNSDGFTIWAWLARGCFYKPISHLAILECFLILCICQDVLIIIFLTCILLSHHTQPRLVIQFYTSFTHLIIHEGEAFAENLVVCVCALWCQIISSVSGRKRTCRVCDLSLITACCLSPCVSCSFI